MLYVCIGYSTVDRPGLFMEAPMPVYKRLIQTKKTPFLIFLRSRENKKRISETDIVCTASGTCKICATLTMCGPFHLSTKDITRKSYNDKLKKIMYVKVT